MHLARNAFALTLALAASLPLTGCTVDATDADADIDLDASGPSLEAEAWDIGGVDSSPEWDSGEINNLSEWKYIKCSHEYGMDYMLTGLNVYQESTGNLDNFIGKMGGVCSQYDLAANDLPQTGVSSTKNIFTSTDYQAGRFELRVPSINAYPNGVYLYVNEADGYVKDIAMLYTEKNVTWTGLSNLYDSTLKAIGHSGDRVTLYCGWNKVMTGMQLKYDTAKGKIRHLEIFCRDIDQY